MSDRGADTYIAVFSAALSTVLLTGAPSSCPSLVVDPGFGRT
jgi:hypothetical protein